jgi:hypothetical protein
MHELKKPPIPVLVEPPSVVSLYLRLALVTLVIGLVAVIAGVIGSLLNDYLENIYRKWINYLQ